jgi:hypothetical protein
MLGDIRLLSVGRRSKSMDEKSMSGAALTDEARQAAEANLSPGCGSGPRMYGARRTKSTSELEAGRPLGRQHLSPSATAVGALASPKGGDASDSDVLFVTVLEVLDLAPMAKEVRPSLLSSPWSTSKKRPPQQLEVRTHADPAGKLRGRNDNSEREASCKYYVSHCFKNVVCTVCPSWCRLRCPGGGALGAAAGRYPPPHRRRLHARARRSAPPRRNRSRRRRIRV